MDLDKFIQKDIIEFLERKQEGKEEIIAQVEEEKLERIFSGFFSPQ